MGFEPTRREASRFSRPLQWTTLPPLQRLYYTSCGVRISAVVPFNSVNFLLVFVPFFFVYWRSPHRYRHWLLLLASYLYMTAWHIGYAGLLLVVTLTAYIFSRLLGAQKNKFLLALGLVFLFIPLFFFKYFNFFSDMFSGPQLSLVLPIGISFYIFTAVGYLVDIYRGKLKPEKNLSVAALFLGFFPNVTAGPIERAKNVVPQLLKKHTFNYNQAVSGLQLFTLGLFKKVVVADNLGLVVNRVFDSLDEYKGLSLVITILFYTWQIYADFSGYTDMARGIARLLGIELLENFTAPYLATSVRDFWRRWHISLSSWFRDYIYIPLGGSRGGLWLTCLNVLIVFALTGLWHGAGWTFIIWGALFGVAIVAERLAVGVLSRVKVPKFVSWMYTYSLVSVAWVFFRAPTLVEAAGILRNSLSGARYFVSPNYIWSTLIQLFETNTVEMTITFGCLSLMILLEVWLRGREVTVILARLGVIRRWSFYVAMVLLILMLRNSNIPQFIYYQF